MNPKEQLIKEIAEESYIARLGKSKTIAIRTKFCKDGFVKISRLSPEEIDKYTKQQENLLELEIDEMKRINKLNKHLTKLRKLRNERKRIL